MFSMHNTQRVIGLLTLIASLIAGCAQDSGTIDRTQPNALKKSLLDGEWYYRQTVVDAPATSAYSFIGDQFEMVRGVFDIQEDSLYMYRTYEFAEDAETVAFRSDKDIPYCVDLGSAAPSDLDMEWCNKDLSKGEATRKVVTRTMEICGALKEVPVIVYRGAPVAAWTITSHFDIINSYNPTSGEKTNVVNENTTDRYWKDREFMRVDFSANSIESSYSMGALADYTSFSVYEGDSAHPDELPNFEDSDGNPTEAPSDLAYFDFLTDHVLEGRKAYLSGYGTIPYCWYYPWYSGGVYECVSERLTVRNSFRKVSMVNKGQPSDYISLDYDDVHMNKYGYFRTERLSFNCNYGATLSGASRKANLHRVWENYERTSDGALDFGKMEPSPIVYYQSENYPRDLVASSVELAAAWAVPFNDLVTTRKGKAPSFPMFILCENSDVEAEAAIAEDANAPVACWSNSSEAHCATYCKNMDRPHKSGDIRYNYLHAVIEPTQAGLYGYGPSSADPFTGEIISAAAYNFAGTMKLGARTALDSVEFLAGIKDWREIENADDRVEENYNKRLKMNGEQPYYSLAEAREIAGNLLHPDVHLHLKTTGLPRSPRDFARERLDRINDSPELNALIGGEYLRLLFRDPRVGSGYVATPEEHVQYGIGSFKHHGGFLAELKYHKDMAKRNIYLREFADGAIQGLANEYGPKYDAAVCAAVQNIPDSVVDVSDLDNSDQKGCTSRKVIDALAIEIRRIDLTSPNAVYLPKALWWDTKDDRIYQTQKTIKDAISALRSDFQRELWQKIYRGVAFHEVGHTLGLRHNFEGSTDAMNYFDGYWGLRGQGDGNWSPVSVLDGAVATGEPFGEETEAQTNGHMRQLQNSTVMDYGAKFNARFSGVGHYDHAAIKYAYGQVVETFDNIPNLTEHFPYLSDPSQNNPVLFSKFAADPNPFEHLLRKIHYTEIPRIFGGNAAKISQRSNAKLEDLAGSACDREAANSCGASNVYCAHYFHGDFCTDITALVPYRFCSDELATYTPSCDMWDQGADSYEIVRNAFSDYEQYWPFWGHMRDNLLFNARNYYSRVYRTFKLGQRHFQYWVDEVARLDRDDWWNQTHGDGDYVKDINGGMPGALGAAISFNGIAQAFGRPVDAWYGLNTQTQRYEPFSNIDRQFFDTTTFVWVGEESGARGMYPSYSYAGNLPIVSRSGAIYDRLSALEVLTDPTTHFLDTSRVAQLQDESVERYLISYYSAFPYEMTNLMGALMTDDHSRFGWCIKTSADDNDYVMARKRTFVGKNAGPCDVNTEVALFPEPKYTFPTTKYRIPAMAAAYSMAYLSGEANDKSFLDQSFLDISHIYLKGHGKAVTPPAGIVETSEFADPLSGKVYVAHRPATPEPGMYYPAYEVIEQAKQAFVNFENQEYYLSDLQYLVGKLELFRGTHSLYSYY